MSEQVIGLDLGASSLKAAQVCRNADGTFVVEKRAMRPLPAGAIIDGRISERERLRVTEELRALVSEAGFDTKRVVYGLNSSAAVFMDELTVPWMDAEDLDRAMPGLIEAQNPNLSASENELSWTVVGRAPGEKPMLRVLVYSARADYARSLAEVIEAAGLEIAGADLNALASLRAIDIAERPAGQLDAIVDIGADVTSVLLHHNGVPKMLSLDPDSAGSVATARIAAAMGVNEDDAAAEFHKCTDNTSIGPVALARNEYATGLANRVVAGLRAYVQTSPEYDSLARLTLIGGGSQIFGLGFFLREALGEVPLTGAALDERVSPSAALPHDTLGDHLVAIGLGMSVTY